MPSDSESDAQPASQGRERLDVAQERLHSPDRIVALSDGVFAIIITILVLELKVPPHLSQESFPGLVEELRPTVVAWVASFLITGMYWVGHRDVLAPVRFVNRDLVWLNLLFLLPASIIPFAATPDFERVERVLTKTYRWNRSSCRRGLGSPYARPPAPARREGIGVVNNL